MVLGTAGGEAPRLQEAPKAAKVVLENSVLLPQLRLPLVQLFVLRRVLPLASFLLRCK